MLWKMSRNIIEISKPDLNHSVSCACMGDGSPPSLLGSCKCGYRCSNNMNSHASFLEPVHTIVVHFTVPVLVATKDTDEA